LNPAGLKYDVIAHTPNGLHQLKSSLFVLSSTQKIPSQKIFQIGSGPCPVPSAIRADPKINVWPVVEARQQTLTTLRVAVDKIAVPKMKNPSRHISDFAGDVVVVPTSPP
jgi:hypothetical protein